MTNNKCISNATYGMISPRFASTNTDTADHKINVIGQMPRIIFSSLSVYILPIYLPINFLKNNPAYNLTYPPKLMLFASQNKQSK